MHSKEMSVISWICCTKGKYMHRKVKGRGGGQTKRKKIKIRKKKAAFQPEIPTPKDLHMVQSMIACGAVSIKC